MKKAIALLLSAAAIVCLLSGCCLIHEWADPTCEAPKTCTKCGETSGEPLHHSWLDATCVTARTCTRCMKTEGGPLGHIRQGEVCSQDAVCAACGNALDAEAEHLMQEATEIEPALCTVCGYMEPMEMPENGQVFVGKNVWRGSQLTIRTDAHSCYIKLKNEKMEDVCSFFVTPYSDTTVDVPTGNLYVYFASGDTWYGPKYLFGENTAYSKDDEVCDFTNYTWEYTLQKSQGGNFSETPIDGNEF